ncbi:N-acetylmuramic acid 6-phosphate etherase [Fulvivirga sediminis]|uniref:N-acetylmuramic acid 6-phosphate etherase n=1 Tax=Fulvivirga sediminis TaxID=2803949 RepID=A0A937JWX8_9BACT|nr:N-acetylmuramic acid 6-phosphate etherase [Fulvivirga sediminis]MBL3654953.1 N-acetylmuramic acid 6-phosphate etherase [Fulvivirga sediminis]
MSTTESSSNFDNLEQMSIQQLLQNINQEDASVPKAVQQAIPQIEALVKEIVPKMKDGGRLFYIGAGTSGRLGILDASEIPPTYGMPHDRVIGLIAGGDGAIRKAVEFAEDDEQQAWKDMEVYDINKGDVVIGIAASGTTPYVIGGVKKANEQGLVTGCITCNADSALAAEAKFPIEAIVGPEFVTGSTRMKAGTAQKLVLNMISTSVMIQLGRVKGNKMVDMQLSNNKLVDRGTRMLMDELSISREEAEKLLKKHGSVRKVIDNVR